MIDWSEDLFWSIDPGESKCGVAVFVQGRCAQAVRSTPDECLDKLWEHLSYSGRTRPVGIVLEQFALRADLAAAQTGSQMGTSQMIGAIRWMARHHGVPVHMQTPRQAHSINGATSRLSFRDWPQRKYRSYGQGADAKMAELHGYFRISTSMPNENLRRAWLATLDTE